MEGRGKSMADMLIKKYQRNSRLKVYTSFRSLEHYNRLHILPHCMKLTRVVFKKYNFLKILKRENFRYFIKTLKLILCFKEILVIFYL